MKKEHLLISVMIVFVLIVAASFLIGTSDSITGAGTQEIKKIEIVDTTFPVDAWGYRGWGDCSSQHRAWAGADAYCKCLGYNGALPASEKPCYHEGKYPRYTWDTGTCMPIKVKNTGGGTAFTKVKCYKELVEVTTCTGEEIIIEPDTCDRVKMTVPLKAGEVDIPVFYLEGGLYYLGKNIDKVLFVNEIKDVYIDGDEYFVVTNEDIRESYLMQIAKLDMSDNQITFKDVMTGDKYMVTYADDNNIDGTSDGTFTIGSLTIDIDVNDPENGPSAILRIDMDDDGDFYEKNVPIYTAGGSKIRFYAKSEGDSEDEIVIIEPSCPGCGTIRVKLIINEAGCTSVILP